jgi:acyl carrier protein
MADAHLARLQRIFRVVLDDSMLQLNEDFCMKKHPEWDSVAMVQIVLAVEEEFNVQLGMDDVVRIKSVADILALL